MISSCVVCNSKSIVRGRKYSNESYQNIEEFDRLKISYCEDCGFGFVEPELQDDFLNNFYTNLYRNSISPHQIKFPSLAFSERTDNRSRSQMQLAKKYIDYSEGDIFVDIGPGYGESFKEVDKIFPHIGRVAIELSDGAAEAYKRIYNIISYNTVELFLETGNRAKIALLSHCLEHYKLSWLKNSLLELKNLVSEEGILIIEVPHVDFRNNENNRFEDSPHCLFFSKDSLRELFEKNGWEVLFINTVDMLYEEYFSLNLKIEKIGYFRNIFNKIDHKLQMKGIYLFAKSLNPNFKYGGNRVGLRMIARPIV